MQTRHLPKTENCATIGSNTAASPQTQAHVLVSRSQLEEEHMVLLRRVHQLRELLGYPPLPTGKKRREEAR
jgi:hypothetical protein